MRLVPRFDRGLARLDFSETAEIAPGVAPASVDPHTGFVRASAFLARDGLLTYGDGETSWQEIRPREELERAALSFANAPLTDLHPDDMVTADTWEDHARGHVIGQPYVTDPDSGGISYLAADILITSADMIATIRDGQAELSIGFWARIMDAPEGTGARFAQVDLHGNHVASVPRGRAGAACRVFLDHAAICAYDRPAMGDRADAQAVEMTDYTLPTGEIVQAPTAIVAQLAQYESKIAELSAALEKEPDMPDAKVPDPDADTQPLDVVPPEPKAEAEPKAKEEKDAKPEPKADTVALDAATARAVIEARMPHMVGKLDGLDLPSLLTAALAMPEPKVDRAQPPVAENPFAEAKKIEARVDETNKPVAEYMKRIGLRH